DAARQGHAVDRTVCNRSCAGGSQGGRTPDPGEGHDAVGFLRGEVPGAGPGAEAERGDEESGVYSSALRSPLLEARGVPACAQGGKRRLVERDAGREARTELGHKSTVSWRRPQGL